MKHIKVRAEFNNSFTMLQVEVLAQTDILNNFGGGQHRDLASAYHERVFIFEDIALVSNSEENFIEGEDMLRHWGFPPEVKAMVHLKGLHSSGGKKIQIPVKYATTFKRAVQAYNEFYR